METRREGHLELCQGNRALIAMYRIWGTEGLSLKTRCIGPESARTPISFYSILGTWPGGRRLYVCLF
jgi:hypothetical protein